jgi:hypothetical protein
MKLKGKCMKQLKTNYFVGLGNSIYIPYASYGSFKKKEAFQKAKAKSKQRKVHKSTLKRRKRLAAKRLAAKRLARPPGMVVIKKSSKNLLD